MKDAVSERVRRVIAEKNFTSVYLSSISNVHQTTIARQISGKCSVSIELVYAILHECPDISSEWLMLGKGSMYKSDNLPPISGNENEFQLLEAANEALREKIKGMEKAMALQYMVIEEKDKRLAMFESFLHGSHEDYVEEKRKNAK